MLAGRGDPPSGEWESGRRDGTMRSGAFPRLRAELLTEPSPPERDTQTARLRSYETLIDVSRMLLGSASLDELFERVTSELRRLVGYDALTIYGVDEVRALVVP